MSEKEKKPFYKKTWFIVLVIIFVIAGASGTMSGSGSVTSSNSSNTTENSKEETTKKSEEETTYHIGDKVVVGDVEYVVNSIKTEKSVGTDYLKVDSKGTFLIVNVTVKNNGDKELYVDSNLFSLMNGEVKYESDSNAGIYANESNTFFLETINPDISTTGNVVFDISDDAIKSEELQLKVQTGVWGTESQLIYLNK